MIKFFKDWWYSENFFPTNHWFLLLSAGAIAAAPFTGFLSLAAIPVFAGMAQTGYLPREILSTGFKKWLFSGNSVNKGQTIPQVDEQDSTLNEGEDHSLSCRSHQSILEQIETASRCSSSSDEAQPHMEVIADLRDKHEVEQTLPDEKKWLNLSDEVLFTLALIYKNRHVLHLNSQDEQEIATLLNEIPEDRRPADYSEEEQRQFYVCQKGCFSWQETENDFRKRLEETGGRKIAAQLLIRFSDDHTRLSLQEQDIPFKTSQNIRLSRSLQSICSSLQRMLIRVFIRKEDTSEFTPDEPTSTPNSWKVSPDFFKDHNELDELFDTITETCKETGQIHDEIGQIHDRRAERFRNKTQKNKQSIAEAIKADAPNFSITLDFMNEKSNRGYRINPQDISEFRESGALVLETVDNLTLAIIRKDIPLAKRCLQTPEHPEGFITKEKIELLIQQGKLTKKVLEKLGFAPPKQTGSSLFSFLPSLTKSNSGSSQSSKGTSSGEEKETDESNDGKKKQHQQLRKH